jgi:DNA-binding NarL/FixJ family response regulator
MISVSIVEDDISLRAIFAEWLSHAKDFRLVGLHGNGRQALTALPLEKPDVVLMDINLPGLDGVECVRQLKAQFPKMQFVMITVYEDPNRIFAALTAGATGYLIKQTRRPDLLAALRDVYAGGSPMSSSIARQVVQSFAKPGRAAPTGDFESLSQREPEVLKLLAEGNLLKEISDSLGLSEHTINTYLRRIYEKLHVHSRAQAVACYGQITSTH